MNQADYEFKAHITGIQTKSSQLRAKSAELENVVTFLRAANTELINKNRKLKSDLILS
jgi:hypothetical protein